MAEAELQYTRRLSADNQTVSKSEISLKERFFRYFQHEITGMLHYAPLCSIVSPLATKKLLTKVISKFRPPTKDGPPRGYFTCGW
jgi:hypothetical protein